MGLHCRNAKFNIENDGYELVTLLFAGFLGLCTLLLLWPGLVILHVTKIEELVWPDRLEWAVLFISGIVGVVISNLLWLW